MNAIVRFLLVGGALLAGSSLHAQIIDAEDTVVAGIPVNYTEAKTGAYTLPDPLVLADGTKVTDAKTWFERRRPEIFRLLEENQFGRAPGQPEKMHFEITDAGTPAYEGKALRKQITIYFTEARDAHYVDLLLYLPVQASGPVPVMISPGWAPNNLLVNDPGVKIGRLWDNRQRQRVTATPPPPDPNRPSRGINVLRVIDRGYGFALFNYTDIDPDNLNAVAHGIRQLYLKPDQTEPAPDEWGAIASWTWGISRIIDYFETDAAIDAERTILIGASRLGKTVLWAGAVDQRVAAVIANMSGEGGAALSRRDYGETVAHLVAPNRFPYQFAGNYAKWADRFHEAPFDAHMILALIAPRAVLLKTGYIDRWPDPYGEFLAAKAATPVFELLGQKGIEQYSMPKPGEPLLNRLAFHMHDAGHAVLPSDWPLFFEFLDTHLKQP